MNGRHYWFYLQALAKTKQKKLFKVSDNPMILLVHKQISNGIQIFSINTSILPSTLGHETQPSKN